MPLLYKGIIKNITYNHFVDDIRSPPQALLCAINGRAVTRGCWMVYTPLQHVVKIGTRSKHVATPTANHHGHECDNILFKVLSTDPPQACVITLDTQVILDTGVHSSATSTLPDLLVRDLDIPPGLEQPLHDLEELIRLPLLHASVFQQLRLECPKGILLYGPPGKYSCVISHCFYPCTTWKANAHLFKDNIVPISNRYGQDTIGSFCGGTHRCSVHRNQRT